LRISTVELPGLEQPLRQPCSVAVGDFVVVRVAGEVGGGGLVALQPGTHPELPRLQQHWGGPVGVLQVQEIYGVPPAGWEPTRDSSMPPDSALRMAVAGRPLWDASAAAQSLNVGEDALPAGVRTPLTLVFSPAGTLAHVLLEAVVRKADVQRWDGRAMNVGPLRAVAALVSDTGTPVRFRAAHEAAPTAARGSSTPRRGARPWAAP
jgi:hypothetical protein